MKLLSYLLTLALGFAIAFDYLAIDELMQKNVTIEKLEADVRTHAGKALDIQESMEDQIAAVRSEESVEKWNLQSQLEECRKNASTPRS